MTINEEKLLHAISLLTQVLVNDQEAYGLDTELRADIIDFLHSDFNELKNKSVNSDLLEDNDEISLDYLSRL